MLISEGTNQGSICNHGIDKRWRLAVRRRHPSQVRLPLGLEDEGLSPCPLDHGPANATDSSRLLNSTELNNPVDQDLKLSLDLLTPDLLLYYYPI